MLVKIQNELHAPKNQYNSFGKYYYRNQEDILNALKPILLKYECTLTLTDDICMIGDRYYVKATAVLRNAKLETISITHAFAREEESKKGMDGAQITGSCSSYARKYCLNAMFLIDDVKDADSTNKGTQPVKKTEQSIEAEMIDEVGEEKRMYLTTLLENTTYDDDMKDKIFNSRVNNCYKIENYEKALENLMQNQIEDKDRIAMGLNYNQTDIKKIQKASKK